MTTLIIYAHRILLLKKSRFFRLVFIGTLLLAITNLKSYAQIYQYKSEIRGVNVLPLTVPFQSPGAVAITNNANDTNFVFVSDQGEVHQYSEDGTFVRTIIEDGNYDVVGLTFTSGVLCIADKSYYKILKYDLSKDTIESSIPLGFAPNGITCDKNGNIYITGNHKIQKIDTDNVISSWGSFGIGDGEFYNPTGIAVDDSGYIYVADFYNRIQKLNKSGGFVTSWGVTAEALSIDAAGNIIVGDRNYNGIKKFKPDGSFIEGWEVNGPKSLTINKHGYIYVCDQINNQIQKLNPDGTFNSKWNTYKTGSGYLKPISMVVDDSSQVYISDNKYNRVVKFKSDGTYLTQWGGPGNGNGQFNSPNGITLDKSGYIYVADQVNNRIQKFDYKGTYLSQFGNTGIDTLNYPNDVTVDSSGNIYVLDGTGVHRFDKNDNYLSKWTYVNEYATSHGLEIEKDKFYISDWGYNLIHQVDTTDFKFNSWTGTFNGDNEIYGYSGLALDSKGYIYASDSTTQRIQQYDIVGNILNKFDCFDQTKKFTPYSIAFDRNDNIYVADYDNNRIVVFEKPLAKILGWDTIPQGVGTYYTASPHSPEFKYRWEYTGTDLLMMASDSSFNVRVITTKNTMPGKLICKIHTQDEQFYGSISKDIHIKATTGLYTLRNLNCPIVANDCAGNYIDNFSFASIQNDQSGCSSEAYTDHTTDSRYKTDIVLGEVYQADINLVHANQGTTTYVGLWIDYNNDGDFEDDQEFIVSSFSSENEIKLNNLHIPNSLGYLGQARLRVRSSSMTSLSKYDGCMKAGESGETEDYMINIKAPLTLEAPQVITPNNDGMNDLFVVHGINPKTLNNLLITDAMGNKVTERSDYKNDWPAAEEATSIHPGTYYYIFKNGTEILKGFFIINY